MIPKDKIKDNFIYKHFNWLLTDNKSNVMIVIIGRPGIGKSTVGQKICTDIDPTFNINRVIYDTESFLKLLVEGDPTTGELKAGQAILFDEIVTDQGADSRSSLSKSNKIMNYINANFRVRRLVVIMCLPSLAQLDKNMREVNVTAIVQVVQKDIVNKVNVCKFFWCNYNAMTQFFMREYPKLTDSDGQMYKITAVKIGLPPKEFEEQYEQKKMEYLNNNLKRWLDIIKRMGDRNKVINTQEVIKIILTEPKKYMINGKYAATLLSSDDKLGIGMTYAKTITGYLNQQLKEQGSNFTDTDIEKKVIEGFKTLK